MGDLTAVLSSLDKTFDVICITETWLNVGTAELISIDNYIFFNIYRSDRRGGGVGIFVHNKFNCRLLDEISYCRSFIECIFLEITCGDRVFVVGCVYKPPDADFNSFVQALEDILACVSRVICCEVFICGDFNLNILNLLTCDNNVDFLNLMIANSYSPVITKPSRIDDTTNSYTLLDNIFCKSPTRYISGLLLTALSDHYPVFLLYEDMFARDMSSDSSVDLVRYRLIDDRTLNLFYNGLAGCDFDHVYGTLDVNESFAKFDEIVFKQFDRCCPIITKTVSYKDILKPWIDREAKIEIRKRDSYMSLMRAGRMRREVFVRLRNRVTGILRKKKRQYYIDKFEAVRCDIRRTWSLINEFIHPSAKNKRGKIDCLKIDGMFVSNEQDVADQLNSYFSNVGANIANSIVDSYDHNEFLQGNHPNSFFLSPVSTAEVIGYISSLKNKKCNIHSLPSIALKYVSVIVAPVICHLINLSISSSTFPDHLKIARIVPLPKGGDPMIMSTYRPISVLNIFSKIVEKHVHKQLYSYLEANDVLTDCQFGFRQMRSTSQAISRHTDYIYESLDGDKIVFSMYLDFKKAFDSVDHVILLDKLSFYGIRGLAHSWFKSYLSNRKQYVNLNNINSVISSVTHSVPQGSNLGPLLFLIYINDLPKCTDHFEFLMFADDCTITCEIPKNEISIANTRINHSLLSLGNWLCANKIQINALKTKYMLYSHRGRFSLDAPVMINNCEISRVDTVKFLGVILDESLSFRFHVRDISLKISRNLGVIRRLCNLVPNNVMWSLYYSLVHPYIIYSINTYFNASDYITNKIKILQKKTVRVVNGLCYNEHTSSSFLAMNLLPIDSLFKYSISIYIYRTFKIPNYDRDLHEKLITLQDQHQYPTRNNFNLVIPRYRKEKSKRSLFYSGVKVWNSIPTEIKQLDFKPFKNRVKTLYLHESLG